MAATAELAAKVGTAPACQALAVPRATPYRHRGRARGARAARPALPSALPEAGALGDRAEPGLVLGHHQAAGPDCGHYPQVEQEATFNYALEKLLGRLPTDRPAIKVS
jgi:hypothetical protein